MSRRRWWATFMMAVVMITRTSSAQSCESTLVALKKASLELETRLKRCRTEEALHCDGRVNRTLSDLSREKEVSVRLRELLNAKDLEKKLLRQEFESEYRARIDELTDQRDELKSQLSVQTVNSAAIKSLEDDLRAEKRKTTVLTDSVEDCKSASERKMNEETVKLRDRIEQQAEKIEAQQETLEARNAEVDTLRKMVARLEEQKKKGILEWFKQPHSIETLLEATNNTLSLFVPGLDATERRLLEIKAFGSEKIEHAIGIDSETSALMSGLLAWGILLIPFFMSFCLLVRVRLSLSKMVLWASLYASLFCLVMFAFSYAIGDEALLSLRKLSPLSHDMLLIILMLGQVLLIVSITLLTLKQWLVSDLGSLRARHMLQIGLPLIVVGHYYYHYYVIALSSAQASSTGDAQLGDDFDERYWLVYGAAYFFECVLVVMGNYSSSSSTSKPSPTVAKAADVVTNIVEVVEGSKPEHHLGREDDVEAAHPPESATATTDGEMKKKKKKKAKHEREGDGSSLEIMGPSEVLDAVVSATSAGRSAKSVEKGD